MELWEMAAKPQNKVHVFTLVLLCVSDARDRVCDCVGPGPSSKPTQHKPKINLEMES